jgi:polysaccharide biosynthesis protein PslG
MDNRVLIGVGGLVAVILIVGVILALRNGDDENGLAEEATPTEEVADAPDADDPTPTPTVDPAPTPEDDDANPTPVPANGDENDDEPEPPTNDATEPASGDYAYGFNIAWRGDADGRDFNMQTQEMVVNAGFNWVRFQVQWSEIQREPDWWDPLPVDHMLEIYEGSDVNVLVSVVGAPEWALDPTGEQLLADWENFVGFMAFMADRYQGRVHAWEIWNEQNMAHEMHGTVRVSDYAYLLEAGYRGVKAADPDALVLFGGLTPTGVVDPEVAIDDVEYLRSFYLYGDGYYAQFFDVMGMHLNATNNPPDTMWPDNPGPGEWTEHGSFYFLRGQQLRVVMNQYGDDRPAWITEFGWTTENQAPGYEYGAEISEEDQANFLVDAFRIAEEEMPWITGMFVWNLNFSTLVEPEDEKYPWSVLYNDWSPRPAYTALQEMPKQ